MAQPALGWRGGAAGRWGHLQLPRGCRAHRACRCAVTMAPPRPAAAALQCDRWEPLVQQGKVYLISKASLRNKRGNFNQARRGAGRGSGGRGPRPARGVGIPLRICAVSAPAHTPLGPDPHLISLPPPSLPSRRGTSLRSTGRTRARWRSAWTRRTSRRSTSTCAAAHLPSCLAAWLLGGPGRPLVVTVSRPSCLRACPWWPV